jgi:hypothetical protein
MCCVCSAPGSASGSSPARAGVGFSWIGRSRSCRWSTPATRPVALAVASSPGPRATPASARFPWLRWCGGDWPSAAARGRLERSALCRSRRRERRAFWNPNDPVTPPLSPALPERSPPRPRRPRASATSRTSRSPAQLLELLEDEAIPARVIDELMGHQRSRRGELDGGSRIGARYHHTTPRWPPGSSKRSTAGWRSSSRSPKRSPQRNSTRAVGSSSEASFTPPQRHQDPTVGWTASSSDAPRRTGIGHVQAVIFWQIFWQTARWSEAGKRFGWWV